MERYFPVISRVKSETRFQALTPVYGYAGTAYIMYTYITSTTFQWLLYKYVIIYYNFYPWRYVVFWFWEFRFQNDVEELKEQKYEHYILHGCIYTINFKTATMWYGTFLSCVCIFMTYSFSTFRKKMQILRLGAAHHNRKNKLWWMRNYSRHHSHSTS